MQINNLSAPSLRPYGCVLDVRLEHATPVRQLQPQLDAPVEELCCTDAVLLDYAAGMSLLVIYTKEGCNLYYLDRQFLLQPEVHFSVVALDAACEVLLYTKSNAPLQVLREHPASQFQGVVSDLHLEKLYTFFYQSCASDFYFRGEQHEAYELVYVDCGQLHNLVGGKDVLLCQQQLMLIGRNKWHTQYADFPVNFLTVSFCASCPALDMLTSRAISLNMQQVALVQSMLDEHIKEKFAYDCVESLLKLLLAGLLRSANGKQEQAGTQLPATSCMGHRTLDQLIRYVSVNAGKKLTVQQLAASAHVSVSYLHRLFNSQLGMTPGAYLAKIRIEESKLLLRTGEWSMGQIAVKLGFSSQQQFSRQFRTVCGITPSEYVRTLR